ncbi:BON domain-containing protein [Falsirhodobacter xinxiangensis]|uniref:BON domain-containing protein n=1 Tax=Falsirhodobacter xinxiangensis TaxID=2530049 RepID=UPI0010AA023B|nr:BON domain-containing protein [Rhodobacter xinxiangensis]
MAHMHDPEETPLYRGQRLRTGGYDDFGTSRIADYGDRRAGYGAYYNDRDGFAARHPRKDRGMIQRAADEVASWLGDHNAELRRVDDISAPSGARDAALLDAVAARLSDADGIAIGGIEIRADRGIVTLTGRVASLAERERAGRLLAEIHGLRALRNELTIGSSI